MINKDDFSYASLDAQADAIVDFINKRNSNAHYWSDIRLVALFHYHWDRTS